MDVSMNVWMVTTYILNSHTEPLTRDHGLERTPRYVDVAEDQTDKVVPWGSRGVVKLVPFVSLVAVYGHFTRPVYDGR